MPRTAGVFSKIEKLLIFRSPNPLRQAFCFARTPILLRIWVTFIFLAMFTVLDILSLCLWLEQSTRYFLDYIILQG